MSEIKGQLLGIILTLMVFGGVSVTVAHVYAASAAKVTDYSDSLEEPAADEIGYNIPTSGGTSGLFPGLSY